MRTKNIPAILEEQWRPLSEGVEILSWRLGDAKGPPERP